LGLEKCNLLLDSIIDFNKIIKLRLIFVFIFKSGMILEKGLKVLEIVYRQSGSILLKFIFKIVKFLMKVKSAITVFHHLLCFFPVLYFSFEGLLLIISERDLEDKFDSFVGIVMPIFLKAIKLGEDKLNVFRGF
jgi:hypothetical protein